MNAFPTISAALCLFGVVFAGLHAQTQPEKIPPPPPENAAGDFGVNVKPEDLLALERFLTMPPEKMREVVRALEKIANLSDEERSQLVRKVKAFRMMNEEKRRNLFYEFKHTSPRERDVVRRYLQSLPSEQRKQMIEQISNMKGPERVSLHRQWMEAGLKAGLSANETLSDVPGDDMPKNLRRAGGPIPGPAPMTPPPPAPQNLPKPAPKLSDGMALPELNAQPPEAQMP